MVTNSGPTADIERDRKVRVADFSNIKTADKFRVRCFPDRFGRFRIVGQVNSWHARQPSSRTGISARPSWPDVKRFSHQINTGEVFDTHRSSSPILQSLTFGTHRATPALLFQHRSGHSRSSP